MAENDYLSQAASFFWPQALGLDKANLKLRERIALAQMMQKRAFPKTFGEGLSAIGEALGDRKLAVELEKLDQGAQADVLKNRAPVAEVSDAPVVQAAPRVPVANNADLEPEPVVAVRPPPAPIPPPNGQPGNRGDTVFPTATNGLVQPQQALPPTIVQPPPPPQPGGRIGDLPPGGPVNRSVAPPGPLPPGNIPAPTLNERLAPAFPGQQSAAPPPPGTPVMAAGDDVTPEEREVGRNALAQAMMQQQAARGGPQPLPTTRAVTPPPPAGGPPADAGIRAAPPPQQQAQALPVQPGAVVGWVPGAPGRAPGVDILGPSPREIALQNFLMSKQNNPYWERSPEAQELARLKGIRELRQQELQKDREAQIARDTKQQELHITGRMDMPERIQKYETGTLEQEQKRLAIEDAREKSILQSRFGGRDPEKVFTQFDTDRESAQKANHALTQFAQARSLLDKGVITGTGQGWKVSAAKVAGAFGIQSAADAVARTEEMQAAIKSTLSIAIENIQGAGGKVSDTDVRIAEGTIGADPQLQLQTIRNLVTRGEKAARGKLNNYEDQVDYAFGGTKAEPRYRVPTAPTAPEPHIRTLLEHRGDDGAKAEFDKRFGPGAADLEIARAKRRERRGG